MYLVTVVPVGEAVGFWVGASVGGLVTGALLTVGLMVGSLVGGSVGAPAITIFASLPIDVTLKVSPAKG